MLRGTPGCYVEFSLPFAQILERPACRDLQIRYWQSTLHDPRDAYQQRAKQLSRDRLLEGAFVGLTMMKDPLDQRVCAAHFGKLHLWRRGLAHLWIQFLDPMIKLLSRCC